MQQPNRNFTSSSYRYGFQGQEKDDELKGEGNSVNYKYRMHDPRVGRFFGIDPLFKKFPWNSPYAFSENRVLDGNELEGKEHSFYILKYYDDGVSITLENVYTLDAKIEMLLGSYNANFSEGAYLLGSDGSFYKIPKKYREGSLSKYGDIEDIMDMATEWKNSDEIFEAAMTGEALQKIGEKAEFAIGVVTLLDGLKNLKISKVKGSAAKINFLKNIKEGIEFENAFFSNLVKEGIDVTRRVSFKAKNSKGKWVRAVLDGIVKNKDGTIDYVETKLKASTKLSKNQKVVYKALENGDAIPVGKNAKKAGLKVGEKMKAKVKRENKYNDQ